MGLLSGDQKQNPQAGPSMEGKKASPETQERFDAFVANGMKIIYTPKFTDSLLAEIKASEDKTSIVGERALQITERVESSAEKNGVRTTANTILNGMNVIVGAIIEVVEAAGIDKFNDEQKYQAFSWAVSNYINNAYKSGRISKEELIALGQMVEAKSGQKMPPGAGMGGKPPQQPPQQMPQQPPQVQQMPQAQGGM